MLALAIALILFGYTVAYAGAQNYANPGQGISLAAAFTCGGPATPVNEPGSQGRSTPGTGAAIRTPGGQTVQIPAPFIGPDISSIGPGQITPGPLPMLQRYGTVAGAGIFGQVVTAGIQGVQTIVGGARSVLGTMGSGARAAACSYLGVGC